MLMHSFGGGEDLSHLDQQQSLEIWPQQQSPSTKLDLVVPGGHSIPLSIFNLKKMNSYNIKGRLEKNSLTYLLWSD